MKKTLDSLKLKKLSKVQIRFISGGVTNGAALSGDDLSTVDIIDGNDPTGDGPRNSGNVLTIAKP